MSAAAERSSDGEPLLEVIDLRTVFRTARGAVPAVDGVSFTLDRGRTLGIVGESGSGKSVLSLSIMNLLPLSNGHPTGGKIFFQGVEDGAGHAPRGRPQDDGVRCRPGHLGPTGPHDVAQPGVPKVGRHITEFFWGVTTSA